MAYHVSREEFQQLVRQAASLLPPQFSAALEEVPLDIRDRPTPRQLASVDLQKDDLLLGLYVGVPLTERNIEAPASAPDVIYIFQEDCELMASSRAELVEQVRVTVLHEIGHHFGLDEDELERLGYR